jgi:hypothetical protein
LHIFISLLRAVKCLPNNNLHFKPNQMKRKLPETAAATASTLSVSKEHTEGEYLFLLPPGTKLDDGYMDA